MKIAFLTKRSFYFCFTALLILIFVSKGFSQRNSGKQNNIDLPALNELPSEKPKTNQVKASNDDGAKVDGLYQTYMKPEATEDGYVYDPVGRRDPFRPFRDTKVGVGQLVVQRERPLEALENFDVKALEVVAIIWGITKPKALIQDPNKVIHTVVKGMRIGKNDGVVAEIREGEVVVMELFDQNGKVVKEPFILPIKR